jgi:hypothetical protein
VDRKFLMVDRRWMVHHHGAWAPKGSYRFRVASPTKHPEPLIIADKPWESMTVNYASVVYDGGLYRLFYDAIDKDYKRDSDSYLCYAESEDCIHWRKPELGLVEYQGSKQNNIILDAGLTYDVGYHGGTVFIDPTADPSERYKIIFMGATIGMYHTRKPVEAWTGIDLIMTGTSSDGLRWKMRSDANAYGTPGAMLAVHSETQRGIWWDPQYRKYIAFWISREPGYNRCIARAETSDFHEWPVPRTVLRCDDRDPVTADMYNNGAMRYESGGDLAYFLMFSMYNHDTDRLNVQLATSRDSYTWFRGDRSAFIDNGPNEFDAGGVYVSPAMVPFGKDRFAILYHGASFKHSDALPDRIAYQGMVGMVTTPRDRFQGVHTDDTFEFSLATFTLESPDLRIGVNAEIRGEIRMALTYYNTPYPEYYGFQPEYVPGVEVSECVPLTGDVLDGQIRWQNPPDLKSLIGRRVELRVLMKQATLYCVRISC